VKERQPAPKSLEMAVRLVSFPYRWQIFIHFMLVLGRAFHVLVECQRINADRKIIADVPL